MAEKLITFNSSYIENFISMYPIDWTGKELSDRGGAGDLLTPVPAVLEFLNLIKEKNALFNQDEYANYCFAKPIWREWLASLRPVTRGGQTYSIQQQKDGVWYRLRRNFFVSMIDNLHAWALLFESGWFDICLIDTLNDVVGKVDLSLIKYDEVTRIALIAPFKAREDLDFKNRFRNNGNRTSDIIVIALPKDRLRGLGNKRWYRLSDFDCIKPKSRFIPKHSIVEQLSFDADIIAEAAAHARYHQPWCDS